MGDIKRIPIQEFVEAGYLSELNRQFLHPLGLALEYWVDQDGNHRLGEIWDYRDKPEGIVSFTPDEKKASAVAEEWEQRAKVREDKYGFVVQPPDHKIPRKTDAPLLREETNEDHGGRRLARQ
jgi:hypothetical protein